MNSICIYLTLFLVVFFHQTHISSFQIARNNPLNIYSFQIKNPYLHLCSPVSTNTRQTFIFNQATHVDSINHNSLNKILFLEKYINILGKSLKTIDTKTNFQKAFSSARSLTKSIPSPNKWNVSFMLVYLSKVISLIENKLRDTGILNELKSSWLNLVSSLKGNKLDALIMLMATTAVIPLFKHFHTSPIVGYMLTGTLLGPSGLNWVRDLHMIDILGELGIVFFLFEMGLELSLDRLKSMRKDVFGLGTSQFMLTAIVGAFICIKRGLPLPVALTIGGSLALSSSAFVLQLLKDKNAMGTRHGKASFGILLLQDLAVVPLLIVVELLSQGGSGLGKALALASFKAILALSTMSYFGRKVLNPIFSRVAKSGSHEAFLSVILTTVLLMSFLTHGIGLSDTLGAFLAGLLLSETSYRYQIEADIAPFRGLLLGLFFITVGFNIDIKLLTTETSKVFWVLLAMILGKASITTLMSMLFGLPFSSAQFCGLLTSQGGELAFVAFGIAEKFGLISNSLSKLLLTTVALSMALTPLLAEIGGFIAKFVDRKMGIMHYVGAEKIVASSSSGKNDFILVCGYGKVGQLVCEMLDKKLAKYTVIDSDPHVVYAARNNGLPVYYGDIHRPEILKKFHVNDAKACIVTLDDMSETNKAIVRLKKLYPELKIIVRAKSLDHKQRIENMFDGVIAIPPLLTEESILVLLPFGSSVLQQIGIPKPEVDAIVEEVRKEHMEEPEVEKEQSIMRKIFGRLIQSPAISEDAEDDVLNVEKNISSVKDDKESTSPDSID